MDWITAFSSVEPAYWGIMIGLIIVITMLLRMLGQRSRKNAEQRRQHAAAIQAALEAEQKRQSETALPRAKVPLSTTRVPMSDPFGIPFTGSTRGVAAKWEAEIHQLGRQILGQIESKMAALQAITLDANRTANRLEILVEHLEQIAQRQIEWQQQQIAQSAEIIPEVSSTVIPATESVPDAAPLADVLKELANDLEGIHDTIKRSTTFDDPPVSATVLRLSELQTKNLRSEVEMLANYGLSPREIVQRTDLSLGEVDLMLQAPQR